MGTTICHFKIKIDMKIIETKVYKFEELNEKAKQKAINDFRNLDNYYDFETEGTFDFWKEKLEGLGFEDIEIMYSGFYSQGDGACFTGKIWLSKYFKDLNDDTDILCYLKHYGNHYHGHSISYSYNKNDESSDFELIESQLNEFEEYCRDLMQQIYKDLETEYDYTESDEYIKETIISNEYDFLENGKMF